MIQGIKFKLEKWCIVTFTEIGCHRSFFSSTLNRICELSLKLNNSSRLKVGTTSKQLYLSPYIIFAVSLMPRALPFVVNSIKDSVNNYYDAAKISDHVT